MKYLHDIEHLLSLVSPELSHDKDIIMAVKNEKSARYREYITYHGLRITE